MSELENKIRQLKQRRDKLQEKAALGKARLEQARTQLQELQDQLQQEYGIGVKQLEALRKQTQEELEAAISDYESKLEAAERMIASFEGVEG